MTGVGYVIAIALVGVVIAVLAWWLLKRRAPQPATPASPPRSRPPIADAEPMTGLEQALDQVTDRSGRKMRDKLEQATPIDDLLIPDDTGPVLRRALDNVEHAAPATAPEPTSDTQE